MHAQDPVGAKFRTVSAVYSILWFSLVTAEDGFAPVVFGREATPVVMSKEKMLPAGWESGKE